MKRLLAFVAFAAALAVAPAAAQYGPYDPEPPGPYYPMEATSYTALWWVPEESGWGLNTNHQDNTVFATLFTYAADGQPMWLVGSNLARIAEGRFSGPLHRTTGPAFNQSPWGATPIGYSEVGTIQIAFTSSSLATVTYSFGGTSVTKSVQRQVFGPVPECVALPGARASVANYQDLWWNPAEPGWGLNIVQQGTIIFTTLFTYSAAGRDMWLVGSRLDRQADGSYAGGLFSTTGPRFDARPWTAIRLVQVGTMTLRFSAGDRATLSYSVNGTSLTKPIVRQVFGAMAPVCR